jgi:outer membrane receptor protein involved in Fe transport
MRFLTRYLILPALVLFASVQLFAQATATGSILGTVTDTTKAVIVGAQVTATNAGTGISRTTITGTSGIFSMDGLAPGRYSIKATKDGFSAGLAKLELLVGQSVTTNFSLKPGAVDQIVEVSADNVLLDVTKTSVSQEITPSQVEELPLLGRDAANLAFLVPGVKMADSFDPTKNRSAVLSVNGNIGREVNVTVNGVDNKDSTVGGTVMQLPLEGVQEFMISTQRFSAANGRSEGAAINMISKSGSNAIHGSLFSYFREKQFNADQKSPDGSTSNPPYERQFFGGSAGGPIVKDRFFGFFAYERQREQTSISESGDALKQLSYAQVISLFGAVPAATIPTPFYENRYNGRLDFKINNKHTAYLSISQQSNNSLNDQEDSLGDLSVGNYTQNHMYIANFTVNSLLTPTLVNTLTLGGQYWNNLISTNNTAAPYIDFAGGAWIGQSPNVSQQSFQRKWQFKDDVTKTWNKHTFGFGFDYIWNPGLGGFFNANSTLEVDYGVDPSAVLANTTKYPQGMSTPGLVTGMSISNGDPADTVPGGTKQIGLYFQDDWKVNRRLTVNLGARWDKDVNLIGGSSMVNSKTFLELKGMGSTYGVLPHDDNKDFSPRVGFSYDLTGQGKHVLRGGFGLYFGNVFQNIPLWMEQQANKIVYQGAFSLASGDTVPGLNILLKNFVYSAANVAAVTAAVPAATSNLSNGATGRTMDPHYQNPYSEEFNVGYQWAFLPTWVFEAEYTHTLGLHSNVDININYTDPNSSTGARVMDKAFTDYAAAANCPTGYCVLGRTMNNMAIGRTRYDGMNLSVRHQLDKHFSISASYTLSRARGYGIDSGGNPNGGSSYHNYPHDPRHPLASWDFGPTPYDELHHITVSGSAKLPYGLEAAPILQFGTGRPYDLNAGYDILALGSGYSRPVIVPNAQPTDYQYYSGSNNGADGGVAARACLAAGTCHIVSQGALRGDNYFELDARLSKNLKFGETRRLQLSFQGFNLTNRPNYGNNFTADIGSSSFATAAGFMNPTSSSTAKAFTGEFGARFTF